MSNGTESEQKNSLNIKPHRSHLEKQKNTRKLRPGSLWHINYVNLISNHLWCFLMFRFIIYLYLLFVVTNNHKKYIKNNDNNKKQ